MATKIARKTASIFGGNLTAAAGGLNVFASFAQSGGTSATYSTDPAEIQSPQWLYGWDDALQGGLPVLEDLNSVDYVNSYQIAYELQQGIPEWDSGTYYFVNSFCSYNGQIYASTANSNLNNTPSAISSYWQLYAGSQPVGLSIIRNPGMLVAQRGGSGTVTGGSPVYTIDGWIVSPVGNNVAWAQVNLSGQNIRALQITPSGTLTDLEVYQNILSATVQSIGYGNVTVQAYIFNSNSSSAVVPQLVINTPTATDNYTSVTNVLTQNLQSIPANSGAIVSYTFNMSSASAYVKGMQVSFKFAAQVASGVAISITNVNLSSTPLTNVGLNSNPPLAQIKNYDAEFKDCEAWLESIGSNVPGGGATIGFGVFTSTTVGIVNWTFHTKKRFNPVLSYAGISNLTLYYGNFSEIALSTLDQQTTSIDGTQLAFSVGSAVGATGAIAWIQTVTSETNLLFMSCEL